MAQIRSTAEIAAKFATVTPGRAQSYADGVERPKKDWEQATTAAESAFEAGVQAAVSQKRFGKGVKRSGNAKWQKGAREKGVARWGPGVTLGQDAYAEGFAPFHDVIERTTLPPRYAKRDPRNLQRVAAIANALGKAKESQLGRG